MKSILFSLAVLFSVGMAAQTQSTVTDSVCSGSQDVYYGIMNPNPGSTFTWSISDPTAGTIDNSLSPNDSLIQIDWGTTPGTYTVYAVETTGLGCVGDTVQLDVVINALPTVALIGDSICSNTASTMTLTFTGQGPWVFDYTDGVNMYSDTAAVSPYVVTLPPYSTNTNISVLNMVDGNGCVADPASLPTTTIWTFGKPTTGAIFHY